MIKDLKRYQIQLTPFQSTKDWAVNNVDNDDLLVFESTGSDDGEPIDLEYIDYNPDSASNNYNCQIALEQQAADVISFRDGEQLTGPFYPDSDPTNIDGTYQRSVYSQIKTSFYNTYRNPVELFGIENIDFERGKTKRRIAEKLRLFYVPRSVFGDKIIPSSVTIYDNSLDNNYTITDDGYGNLQAGTNLFSKQQEIGDFNNDFAVGYSSVCDTYFSSSTPPTGSPAPTGSIPTGPIVLTVISGSAILDWTYASTTQDYFAIQKSLTTASYSDYSTVIGSLRTYTDVNVSVGNTYWYRVAAVNTIGTSSFSNTASITFTGSIPTAPITLIVVSGSAICTWISQSNDQDFFALQKSADGISYSDYADITGSLATYTDENVSVGNTYWYQVASVNTIGTSSFSNTASITFTAIVTASLCTAQPQQPGMFGTITSSYESPYLGAGYYADTQSL